MRTGTQIYLKTGGFHLPCVFHDFKTQFGLWQEKDCLYYPKGKIQIPVDVYDNLLFYMNINCFIQKKKKEDMKIYKRKLSFRCFIVDV